jgi:uncharacterized membrane protein HdeD (DUF308 family)
MLNTSLSIPSFVVGLVIIMGGIVFLIFRLSRSEWDDDEITTQDGDRLIRVGFGTYETEGMVMFEGMVAIIIGIIFVIIGILT